MHRAIFNVFMVVFVLSLLNLFFFFFFFFLTPWKFICLIRRWTAQYIMSKFLFFKKQKLDFASSLTEPSWYVMKNPWQKEIFFNNSAQAGAPSFVFGTKAPFAFEELMAHRVPRVTLPFALCCVRHRYKSLGIHR